MVNDKFLKRKKDILSKIDKSSKQCWDKKIVPLCKKINSLKNYYTTSSCSGRIVIIKDKNKKQENLFLKVYHDLIKFGKLKNELEKIARASHLRIDGSEPDICQDSSLKEFVNAIKVFQRRNPTKLISKLSISEQSERSSLIKFKQEPCILHVACIGFDAALGLLKKAQLAGFKRSGIISNKGKFVCELLSTEKLEFPIVDDGKILVDDNFLKIIVKKSNENLEKSWLKIQKLNDLL